MEKLGLEKEGEGIYYNIECVYYKIIWERYLVVKVEFDFGGK